MSKGILFFIGIFLSYLMGSVPTAYILVRLIKKLDIRKLGSGNVGATNASRILGKGWGIFILIIDMLKAFIPVVFFADYILKRTTFLSPEALRVILGVFAVIGHNWPIFLKFRGGKGVASTFGVLFGLALKVNGFLGVLIFSIIIWIITLLFSKIVSFSSILTALFLPLLMIIFKQTKDLIVMSFVFSVFIFLKHLPNIKRILQGKEPRI